MRHLLEIDDLSGPELLRVYGDIGLTAFPLASPGQPAQHYLACRAERDLERLMPLLPKEPAGAAAARAARAARAAA